MTATTRAAVGEVLERRFRMVTANITADRLETLVLLRQQHHTSPSDLALRLHIPQPSAERILAHLEREGVARRLGWASGPWYRLAPAFEAWIDCDLPPPRSTGPL